MDTSDLLIDAFGRIKGIVHRVVDGLEPEQLVYRPDPEANSIAWLIWHLTRIQDDHLAHAGNFDQVWTSGGWAERFALPFDVSATGYGQRSEDVSAVRVESGDLLTGYHDAVQESTAKFLRTLSHRDLDRIVDKRWDPPVMLGARLVSVISDGLQHAGQAAYVRGLCERK